MFLRPHDERNGKKRERVKKIIPIKENEREMEIYIL